MTAPDSANGASSGSLRALAEPALDVRGLSLWYGRIQALDSVSMIVPKRRITAVVGRSGCGKSTFVRCLNRLNDEIEDSRIRGTVLLDGRDIYDPLTDLYEVRRRVGMVFQRSNPFFKSIYENIAYGPRVRSLSRRADLDAVVERCLRDAGLWDEVKDRLRDSALALSLGQQQRLCIARSLAAGPDILLMDEPCSALDPLSTGVLEELILRLKERYTIVIVTHDLHQTVRIADFVAMLARGRLEEFGDCRQMFTAPASRETQEYFDDIIQRHRAEQALAKAEEQYRQAQKMEAVGRLAGGIAHDFNNLLTSILGYSNLLIEQLPPGDPDLRQGMEEIRKAGERAASLTGQLLSFSRKQVLQPRILSLNQIILDMNRMLRRLLPENVEFFLDLDPDIGSIKADPTQMEQVLLNLVVNARDAMPGGGRLRLSTQSATLDPEEAVRHEVAPGPYVVLSVTDTGVGMSEETLKHLFEPFARGRGPGSGWRPSTASSGSRGGRSKSPRPRGGARSSGSTCPARTGRPRPSGRGPSRLRWRGKKRSCLWRTRSPYGTWPAASCRGVGTP